jgi:hypothetical protein
MCSTAPVHVRPQDTLADLLAMLHTGQGDPLSGAQALLRAHPAFVAGHCLHAALLVMAGSEDALPALAHTLQRAEALPAGTVSERERRHLSAARAWLERDLKESLQLYGDIAANNPLDTLALRVAHFGDLQWGRTAQLRDRIAAALPHWNDRMPGYGHVLGMYAFGLAENAEHAQAAEVGRRALSFDKRNAGAVHAVAHALDMQGQSREGIEWLQGTSSDWTCSASYAPHLWWHQALCHLDLDDIDSTLRILDARLPTGESAGAPALVDASALLWRLQLRGIDAAERWQRVASAWAVTPERGLRPFNDTHAILAYVGAGRQEQAERLMKALRASAERTQDLQGLIAHAALPVCEAAMRFGAGDYAAAVQSLLQHRHLAQHCGGSRAQCDLVQQTLLEASMRDGQWEMARSLVEERIAARPHSEMNHRLIRRCERRDRRCRPIAH